MLVWLLLPMMLPGPLAPAAEKGITDCYVREATWPETMFATRRAYRNWSETDPLQAGSVTWGPWYQAGPFPSKSFSTALWPEKQVNLKAKSAEGKRLWKKQPGFEDGQVHSLPPNVVGPTYLYRTVTSPRAMRMAVGVGSDDGIMVKLNGQTLFSKDVFRGVSPGQDRVELDLKAGVNDLLLKIYNQRGGHGFSFASQSQPLLALWVSIERDFPREARWMEQDLGENRYLAWFEHTDVTFEIKMIRDAIDGIGGGNTLLRHRLDRLVQNRTGAEDVAWMRLYNQACVYRENLKALAQVNIAALAEAVQDLKQTFPDHYPGRYFQEVADLKRQLGRYSDSIAQGEQLDPEFWMGGCEITNAQYALFDPTHDSRYIDQRWKDHTTPGYPANRADQPVIRISWQEAMAFCEWLSARSGVRITLPTEAQWEWACRAGSDTAFSYGTVDTDFSSYANLADRSIQLLAVSGVNPQPVKNPDAFKDFVPRDMRFNDGEMIVASVGQYRPNAWGLYDMHGNVAEWTRSVYAAYPYVSGNGRRESDMAGQRVVREGSWRDRPQRARSASR